ncbi:putative cytochrome p450 protein [Neofusicoccum parvum UCRNP2]|uniref:Putative cytochrome p450 protein n=1 Tax=Botryosphaeria parva (strain UCR-NP2) TaxID=1287680 RepID=R1G9F8_BOTPV|nr:putative cytochrome p450 protein [Neofusicoccum parvum UCRNP2]
MANKAAWITTKKAQPLQVADAPKPVPGPGEVIIKNAAVAIIGKYRNVLGVDCGDSSRGAFQLYTKAKELLISPIPDDLAFERAVVLPLAISAASSALYSSENLGLPLPSLGCPPTKKLVLVWGGSSCCGSAAVQLATASGFTVLATASKQNFAYVRSLGAKMVLDYHDPHVVAQILDVVDQQTLAGVFDAISTAETIEKWSRVLDGIGGGRVAMTSPPPDEMPKSIRASPVELQRMELHEQFICDAVWRNYVPAALVSGHLKAKPEPIVIRGGLGMIQHGMQRLRQGVSAAKVVVTFFLGGDKDNPATNGRARGIKVSQSPIVRIGPNEVHIRDPAYYEVLFNNNLKIEKDPWFYKWSTEGCSAFATVPGDLYRLRRSALSKSFSASAMDRHEPVLQEKVKKLLNRLDEARKTGEVVDMAVAFRAYTMDCVSGYVLPHSWDYLDQPDLGKRMQRSHTTETTLFNWRRHTPWLLPLLRRLPDPLSPVWDREYLAADELRDHYHKLRIEAENIMRTTRTHSDPSISVAESIRTSPLLPEHERSFTRIMSEIQSLLGAGVDAPATSMSSFVYHMLRNPALLSKLRAELRVLHTPGSSRKDSIHDQPSTALPDLVPFRTLEKLEYLQAAVREALRLHPAVLSRQPRVNPAAPMAYVSAATGRAHTLPPGTTVSMSITGSHLDPTVFPDPARFRPERWLEASPARRARMDRAFVPFGRGARMCLGHELARRELSLALGNLFRVFEMEVAAGTTEADLANAVDFFGPLPERGRGVVGVRVKGLY